MVCRSKGEGSFIAVIGRLLIAAALVIQAVYFSMHFSAQAQAMAEIKHANVWNVIVIVLQFLAGLFIFLGWLTRLGGFLMLVSVVLVTWFDVVLSMNMLQTAPVFSGLMRYSGAIGFTGIAIYLMAFGSGKCGLDALRHCNKKD